MKNAKQMPKEISAEEFDRMFDAGEDISAYVDWDKATHLNLKPRVVNVAFFEAELLSASEESYAAVANGAKTYKNAADLRAALDAEENGE